MRIVVQFGRMCLSFRRTLDLATHRTDPRGLTGSELGCIRIAKELAALGHDVTLQSVTDMAGQDWEGIHVRDLDDPIEPCDVVIAINEPDLLRAAPAGAFRVCLQWLNDVSYCKVGFEQHVDLFLSPSAPHLEQVMTNLEWRKVEKTPEHPDGKALYEPDAAKWAVVELGCDPERYEQQGDKVPGRVVYCSSPDRGLHWLLQEWPAIKRAVPNATLHIFYRLEPWLRGFDQTPWFPPIEPLRSRSNYVEECLTRFREHGGMGVTLRDSVSRETIEREMAQAEVLGYPCDTTTWSEGFSCTTLEACAAGAVPVLLPCDALPAVYGDCAVFGENVEAWREAVIRVLRDEKHRAELAEMCRAFASKRTWRRTAERIMEEIDGRRAANQS